MVLDKLNSGALYLICGGIVAFIAAVCVVFLVRAWRAGKALGMDVTRMKRAITSSATFSVLPSVGILLGVIALSGSLGTPWPWLRLSVIGALHYETQVASAAAEQLGIKLSAEQMTLEAFSSIALLMSLCIVWGMVLAVLFNRRYLKRLQRSGPADAKKSGGFGDRAMVAMFIGMVSAYLGSYIGAFVSTRATGELTAEGAPVMAKSLFAFGGDWTPLVVALTAALAMAVFVFFSQKKGKTWLDSFSIAGSMLVGMLSAVLVGVWTR